MSYHPDFQVSWNASHPIGGSSTNVVYSRSGKRYAAQQRSNHVRSWSIELNPLGYTDAMEFIQFVEDRFGSYDPFYWFSWYYTSRNDQFVEFGDGSTTTYNLPFKGAQVPPLIYVASILQTSGSDYTYNPNAGTGGEDQIVFASAPAPGDLITCSFTRARQRHFVAFTGDKPEAVPSYGDGAIRLSFHYQLEEVI